MFLTILTMFLCTGLLIPGRANFAEDEKWYFALDWDSGKVMAYTAEGEMNVILETGIRSLGDGRVTGMRVNEQSALAVFTAGETYTLYHLTPDAAYPVETPIIMEEVFVIHAVAFPYVVLSLPDDVPVVTALLVNLETHTAELIGNVFYGPETVMLSEDGQKVRYLRRDTNDTTTWYIAEHVLSGGEERIIYTLEEMNFPVVMAGEYGEHWLIDTPGNENSFFILVKGNGLAEVIAVEDRAEGNFWFLRGDTLISTPLDCETNCPVELRSFSGEILTTMTVPQRDGFIFPVLQPDESHLIILKTADSAFIHLGADGTATTIGYWSPQMVFTQVNQILSPDGHWLLVINDPDEPTGYGVWNTINREFVLENTFRDDGFNHLQIVYTENGFIVWESSKYAFAYQNESVLELPEASRGVYFDITDDGSLLYNQYPDDDSERATGIYRYDPAAETFTLLAENAATILQ